MCGRDTYEIAGGWNGYTWPAGEICLPYGPDKGNDNAIPTINKQLHGYGTAPAILQNKHDLLILME